jgi:uncharacterized protein YdhG (YjbR/CyaY superfamily)
MGKMRSYPSFDAYLEAQAPPQQAILREVRALVKRSAPELAESVKWGNGCWVDGKAFIAYVYCAPDHVQFGFVNGSALADPRGLLQGSGRFVRHVKLRRAADVAPRVLAAFLREAVARGHPAIGKERQRRPARTRGARKPATIDEYLAPVSGARRVALERLRKTIRSIIPRAEECIRYNLPAFRLDGVVVAGFCATAKGCSYFPFSGKTLETLAPALEGYERTKGSLHFSPDKPLPATLVRRLIRARMAEAKK